MVKKTSILILLFILTACSASSGDEVTFVRTVDGDTLIANVDGKEEYVRLLLVDTPETKHPDKEVQPFGPEANELIDNTFTRSKPIELEFGTEKRDKYDRLLAYVYTEDGQMVNKLLLKKGLARVAYVYPSNDKYVDDFREIEQKAKEKEIGVWSVPMFVTEDGFNSNAAGNQPSTLELPYDPSGPDRDCGDFYSQKVAQAFFEAAGGPDKDPHRLDGEGDGLVCEGL